MPCQQLKLMLRPQMNFALNKKNFYASTRPRQEKPTTAFIYSPNASKLYYSVYDAVMETSNNKWNAISALRKSLTSAFPPTQPDRR